MSKKMPTTDAVEILYREFFAGRPERIRGLQDARVNDSIARKVFETRTALGLSQAQLAKRVGTTTSVIRHLEDAEYEGDPIVMARRIIPAGQQ